jgi:DNA-directed RNA polymerase subunit RPC12/RpoP
MAASIILAKCSKHNHTFGVRVEKRENDWVSTWAFPIDDKKAKREGFDRNEIKGSLLPTADYPGCPYCGEKVLVHCACGKMICYRENSQVERKSDKRLESKRAETALHCHWCGTLLKEIQTVDSFTVKSGVY